MLILIIGSAPDALEAQNLKRELFGAIVAINNAWNIIEGVGRLKQSIGVSYIEVEKCLPGSI